MQNADRQIEKKRTLADQVLSPLLDHACGDGIGIAVERGLVDDAIAGERGFRLCGHLVPHQPLGHVPGGRDQNETCELCDSERLIGRLQRACQQVLFAHGLRGVAWICAG